MSIRQCSLIKPMTEIHGTPTVTTVDQIITLCQTAHIIKGSNVTFVFVLDIKRLTAGTTTQHEKLAKECQSDQSDNICIKNTFEVLNTIVCDVCQNDCFDCCCKHVSSINMINESNLTKNHQLNINNINNSCKNKRINHDPESLMNTTIRQNKTIQDFNNSYGHSQKGLKLTCHNIQHILPKIDEIRANFENLNKSQRPDIIGMSETFLNEKKMQAGFK
ncbi:unnamed protein product [Mytilus coruscus]|uniref:Endonuclease/exonuclease/phosphatase domain-containing protein n=1 Tax=Mytilus coruscus TaxID=42192 RepID=A0A6J8DEE9_MYTCO|nr:unnamed protein product [Mytilus coruscus]